jgi:hypothetical protein
MATKDDTTTKAPAKAPAAKADEPAKDTGTKATATATEDNPKVSTCLVNDGRGMHVGNAVNGKVCSYHAMHYDRNGKRR